MNKILVLGLFALIVVALPLYASCSTNTSLLQNKSLCIPGHNEYGGTDSEHGSCSVPEFKQFEG